MDNSNNPNNPNQTNNPLNTPPNPWGNSNPPSGNTWSSPIPQPPIPQPNQVQTTFPPWNPPPPPQNATGAQTEPIPGTISQNPSPWSTTPQPPLYSAPPPVQTPQVQPDLSANTPFAPSQTFPPPQPISQPSENIPTPSPLDNPWAAPLQPPEINGGTQSDFPPPQPSTTQWPGVSASPAQTTIQEQYPPPTPESLAPTDLSHLITGNKQPDENPNGQNAETLVVPSTETPEVPTNPVTSGGGIPKWLIGVGIGLLILVAGASAYFILGVGRPPEVTTSIPAEVAPPKQVEAPTPVATLPPQQAPEEGSANFGELEGNSTTSNSGQTPSAIDAARQRQQTGQ